MKSIERIFISSFVAVCFCLTPEVAPAADTNLVPGATSEQGTLNSRDAKFVREASQGNLTEQRIGQLTQSQSQNSQVKEFGQKLISDHSKAQEQLIQLAQKKGFALATELDKSHSKMVEHLQALSGAEFDRTVLRHMVRDHETDIREFERAANKGDDTDVKEFAANTLPTLRDHLNQARKLEAAVTGTEPAGAKPPGSKY